MTSRRVDPVRVFISYSHKDRELVGEISELLRAMGLNTFLAHNDLRPSTDWQSSILENLQNCDVFLAMLTNNFPKSNWTDQESGAAYMKKKLIVPIEFSLKPYGFISKYQSLKFKDGNKLNVCLGLVNVIQYRNPKLRKRILNSIIAALPKDQDPFYSFCLLLAILQFDYISKRQLHKIMHIVKINKLFSKFSVLRRAVAILQEEGVRKTHLPTSGSRDHRRKVKVKYANLSANIPRNMSS